MTTDRQETLLGIGPDWFDEKVTGMRGDGVGTTDGQTNEAGDGLQTDLREKTTDGLACQSCNFVN